MPLTEGQQEAIKRAAGYRCEYCSIRSWPLTVDHIMPQWAWDAAEHLGVPPPPFDPDDPTNLAAACWPCNLQKGKATTWVDPDTGDAHTLFHPRQHRWEDHFEWDDDCTELIGVTDVGRATVMALELWRGVYVEQRAELRAAARCGRPPWP